MRVNIFIRQENEGKWKTIANKSEWINTLLANSNDTSSYGATKQTPIGPMVTVLSETLPATRPLNPTQIDDLELFKEAYSDGVAKPPNVNFGYPCCVVGKCKHWEWDGEVWRNQLTGKARDEDL